MTDLTVTRLTKSELDALEYEAAQEIAARLGTEPRGTWGQRALAGTMTLIAGAGRALTLLAAELIQAAAALVLLVVFAGLENERIWAGALALGQRGDQAQLIALALVTANIVLPIYRLRNVRGAGNLTRRYHTVRGAVAAIGRRLFMLPYDNSVDLHDNPTLNLAESAVTWGTLAFALFAVLGPIFEQYGSAVWHQALARMIAESDLTQALQISAGFLLSIGGVFMLQSIAHEIGVRTVREASGIAGQRAAYRQQAAAIRENTRERIMRAKLADKARRDAKRAAAHPTRPPAAAVGARDGHGAASPRK